MHRERIYPGLRAQNVCAIGRLPVESVVKVIAADEKKVTIEAVVDGMKRKYFLSADEFRRDFNGMKFFAGPETEEPSSSLTMKAQENGSAQNLKPHSQDYLYTSVL